MVRSVLAMSARSAVFGFLGVFDGDRAIEDGAMKGELVLELRRNGAVGVLTDGPSHLASPARPLVSAVQGSGRAPVLTTGPEPLYPRQR